MNRNLLKSVLAAAAALTLVACSSEPAKTTETKTETEAAKKPAGPPEPIAARDAFFAMYKPAFAWASDMQVLTLTSGEVAGVKNADGKAGLWTAVFASPSLRMARTFTYAVADQLPTITKGVKEEGTEPWGGGSPAAMPFATGDFMIDSDAAYKTAAAKAADFLKDPENAKKPVSMTLGAAKRFPAPVWVITFGTEKNGFRALVNASDGSIITK